MCLSKLSFARKWTGDAPSRKQIEGEGCESRNQHFSIRKIEVSEFCKDSKTTEFETATEPMIHMDCMAFGMGCCCLQVTFQASDLDESRLLYDQLAVLAPIMLALTAATWLRPCASALHPSVGTHGCFTMESEVSAF